MLAAQKLFFILLIRGLYLPFRDWTLVSEGTMTFTMFTTKLGEETAALQMLCTDPAKMLTEMCMAMMLRNLFKQTGEPTSFPRRPNLKVYFCCCPSLKDIPAPCFILELPLCKCIPSVLCY